ncbi:MAG: hypothetical protein K5906_04195, partial [Bacilli bacterium]|nr:hypothetical protein [Bacilli bacterium]
MNQAIRVEKAPKSKRLIAMLIDIAILTVSTVGLFLLLLYLVIGPMFNYSTKVETKTKMMNEYGLTLSQNESVDAYEAVIKKFYFEYFPNEIQETIKNYYPNEKYSSITHIYNVYVYNLPYAPEPTGDKYKGDLYEYQISKETGAVLVDELGVKRSDMGGSAYERYLKELMYSKYSKLEGFLI